MSDELERIANMAIATRTHLVEACKGLDEIIRLAQEAGRDDVKAAAEAAKAPVKKAAKAFNDGVAKAGGNASKVAPIIIEAADEAASAGKKTTKELLEELQKKVEANKAEADSAFALLGLDFKAGSATVIQDGWAYNVNKGLKEHQSLLQGEDGASGIVKDVAEMKAHLGHTVAEDGTVSFADRTHEDSHIAWGPAVIALVIALVIFVVIMATGYGPVWASGWAMVAVIIGVIVFLVTNRKPAALAQQDARGKEKR